MIEAFIFDVDGTLIDSNDFHAQAWQKAFSKYGKNFSFDEIRPHIGKGADTLLPSFLTKKEIEKFGDEIAEARGEIFKKNICRALNRSRKCANFLKNPRRRLKNRARVFGKRR